MGLRSRFATAVVCLFTPLLPFSALAQKNAPLATTDDAVIISYADGSQEPIFPSDLESASGAEFDRLVGNIMTASNPRSRAKSAQVTRLLLFALDQKNRNGERKIAPARFLQLVQQNRSRFYRDKTSDHAEELQVVANFASLEQVYRYLSCKATVNRNQPGSLLEKVGNMVGPDRDKKFILLTEQLLRSNNYDNYLDTGQRNRVLAEPSDAQEREAQLACARAYETGQAAPRKNLSEPALRFIATNSKTAPGDARKVRGAR